MSDTRKRPSPSSGTSTGDQLATAAKKQKAKKKAKDDEFMNSTDPATAEKHMTDALAKMISPHPKVAEIYKPGGLGEGTVVTTDKVTQINCYSCMKPVVKRDWSDRYAMQDTWFQPHHKVFCMDTELGTIGFQCRSPCWIEWLRANQEK